MVEPIESKYYLAVEAEYHSPVKAKYPSTVGPLKTNHVCSPNVTNSTDQPLVLELVTEKTSDSYNQKRFHINIDSSHFHAEISSTIKILTSLETVSSFYYSLNAI